MLKCKEVAQLSSDFVEHKLSRKERMHYYIHLIMCGHCRRYIAQFRRFLSFQKNTEENNISDVQVDAIVDTVKKAANK